MSSKYNPQMPSKSYDPNDYRVLRNLPFIDSFAEDPSMRFDSGEDAGVFFAGELDHIKAEVYNKLYPQFTALSLFPVSSEAPIGADTISYYGYDKVGEAKFIHDYASDLPRADVFGQPVTRPIKTIGTHYGYSNQEMRASRMAGKSLDILRGEAAKYTIDYLTNRVAWAGDTETGLDGVLSVGNDVPVFALPNDGRNNSPRFVDKTPEQILRDIAAMVRFVAALTKSVEQPDNLALPTEAYLHLFDTPRSPASDFSVGQWVLQNMPRLKTIVEAPELNHDSDITPYPGIDVGFMFSKNRRKFSIEIPMPFYQYPIQPRNLGFIVPCESRIAGALIYYPKSMLIIPGV